MLFEAAWKAYPNFKGRSSKVESLAAWAKLPIDHQEMLPTAVAAYGWEGSEPNRDCGAPAMERWIRKEKFVDGWPLSRPRPLYCHLS